jgi:capsular polysaccharide biosynthesis protein
MEKNTNEELEIDLLDLFYLLKARLLVILLSGVLFASAAGLISSFLITPLYTSKSKLYILSMSTSITSFADIQIGSSLTQDYMVLVKSRPVVTKVIEELGLNMTYEGLVERINVTNPNNTRILEIEISYPDAYLAKQIVDTFAQVSKKQIAKIMDAQEPTIVEEGYMQPRPSSPNVKKFIVFGGLAGIILAAGVVVVLYILDDTIKDAEDVEKHLGLTTIGLIPIEAGGLKQAEIDKRKRKRSLKKPGKKEKR